MPCAICGGSTLAAGKLCSNCKAALKRARRQTVSQLEPLPRRPSRGRRASTRTIRAGVKAKASRPSSMRLPATLVALGVVVIAMGYVASHLRGAAAHGADLAAPRPTPVATPYVPLPTTGASLAAPSEPFLLPAREALPRSAPLQRPPQPARVAKTTAPAREPIAQAPDAAVAAAEPVVAAPMVAAKAEPPQPDRWQLLAGAVAQCGGGLGGALCAERVRWTYCDGFWGKVAQCPGPIGADVPR